MSDDVAGIDQYGSISAPQLSQLAAVNRAVNVNKTFTDYSVFSGGQLITNFAAAKPSWLMSNDGVTELPTNSSAWYSSYGNCNWTNANVYALAGNEYAWNYEVDLGAPKGMNYYVVEFPTNGFATDFAIEGSNDRAYWPTLKTVHGITSGGRYAGWVDYFAEVPFRYVRVRAIAPNGPNQTGTQMAIRDFEVYDFPVILH